MKALTLWRPWSDCIVRATPDPKNIEHRTWFPPPAMLGRFFAVHGGKTFDDDVASIVRHVWADCPSTKDGSPEGIVGIARYVAAIDDGPNGGARVLASVSGFKVSSLLHTPWWGGGPAWVLADQRALANPVPCRGAQSLWTVPPDVEDRVRRQLP